MDLNIRTQVTGFASPAESYVDRRLDLNELIAPRTASTFFLKYQGPDRWGLRGGNILVIDRSVPPLPEELVVLSQGEELIVARWEEQPNLWGRISWILKRQP